jgi:dTDP-4-amino-4,6-dideoxygalactose transaminase
MMRNLIRLATPRARIRFGAREVLASLKALYRTTVIAEFEQKMAQYLAVQHAVFTSSGKSALALLLKALGAKKGDRIVLASYNVPEVPQVLLSLGLVPVFVDVDRDTYNISPERVRDALKKGARFLLATHLYGHPADMDSLLALAREFGAILIEDCAQALGAKFKGKRLGSFGIGSIFSFGLMKNLNTLYGGLVATNDQRIFEKVKSETDHARRSSHLPYLKQAFVASSLDIATSHPFFDLLVYPLVFLDGALTLDISYKLSKMRPKAFETGGIRVEDIVCAPPRLAASIGLAGLDKLDHENAMRKENAKMLIDAIKDIEGVRFQKPLPDTEPVWTNFVICHPERDNLRQQLLRKGIDCTRGYLLACHRLFSDKALLVDTFDESQTLERQNLYLPCHPDVTSNDIQKIRDTLCKL